MRRFSRTCLLCAAAIALLSGTSWAGVYNGEGGIPLDDPPLPLDVDWYASTDTPPAFFWSSYGPKYNNEGPYTFYHSGMVKLYVTDDFLKGDQFEVFDWGSSIGTTSYVPTASGYEVGPHAAYLDPTYSSGVFLLGPGYHSITLQTIYDPWYSGGRGYIKAETMAVPEPATAALLGTSLICLVGVGWRRKKRTAK